MTGKVRSNEKHLLMWERLCSNMLFRMLCCVLCYVIGDSTIP